MIIKEEEPCVDVGLNLALGLPSSNGAAGGGLNKRKHPPVQFHVLFPSRSKKERREDDDDEGCVSRDRYRVGGGAGLSGLSLSSPAVDDDEDSVDKDPKSEGGARKKLRLSKEQSALLEESFRQHSTLNPAQKQELARTLNLRPRQVEVWFQNRRARTKLKQTEVDCEFLKKCCETLTDENRRLKRELHELRSMRAGTNYPLFLQHLQRSATATTAMCPSCERVAAQDGGIRAAVKGGAVPTSSPKLFGCAASVKKDATVACCK